MSEAKHTPGPWEAVGMAVHQVSPGGREIIFGAHNTRGGDEDERRGNARLIAAAPELLDALRETLRALESHLDESCRDHGLGHRDMLCSCNQHEVVRARAAIAKAEGR